MIPAPSTDLSDYFYLDDRSQFHFDIPESIVDWDTRAVTSMELMFSANPFGPDSVIWDRSFLESPLGSDGGFWNPMNLDIGGWDTRNVQNMSSMFTRAPVFNQDIGGWDTGNVTIFAAMFSYGWAFNQDIGEWDTSSARSMTFMFQRAEAFNQDISQWDVSNVTGMGLMFAWATAFDQDLGDWDISSLNDAFSMFDRSGMSMENFDATLEGWATLDPGETRIPRDITLGAGGLVYSNAEAFNTLQDDYGWTIHVARYYLDGTTSDDVIDASGEGAGVRVEGLEGNDLITGSAFNDTLSGLDDADTLEGGLGADVLIGGEGDDILYGALMSGSQSEDRADRIYAGGGNDLARGGYGNDELRGDAGHDTLIGEQGADSLYGGTGDDVLTGAALSDLIFGGDGDDFLNGGFGYDRLNGGTGADRFFHSGAPGHGTDWVQDYAATEGDVLHFGGSATADDFRVRLATTDGAGADATPEAFVIHQPTGQIMWALVDGGGQSSINLQVDEDVFNLLV
ncbi:MAG: BspA family leucine-rich repeat surface protein [Shimia thalassica]|uniref:BspA family leucine-rich repeat surface protein n=2 Tax=Shimia thalassica TaxID=1715693 RepID=UPI0032990C45